MAKKAQSEDSSGDGAGGERDRVAPASPASRGGGPLVHPTDLRLSLVILAVCAGLYYVTTTFEQVADMFAQDIPPEFFPRLLIWTIVVLTLLMPFEHLYLRRQKKDVDADRGVAVKPMAFASAGLLCLVVASMILLGTLLAMVLVCLALPLLWGERRLKVLIPYAVIFPGLVTLLFSQVMKVHFEPGLLGPMLY